MQTCIHIVGSLLLHQSFFLIKQEIFFFGTKKSTEPKKKETKRLIEHSEACKHQKCHQKGGVEAL